MSIVNNFNLRGVANDVTFGKRGGRMIYTDGTFKLTANDTATVSRVKIASGVDLDDAVSMLQLTTLETDLNTKIGDLDLLETVGKESLVVAINEVRTDFLAAFDSLGTMAMQDADEVEITGGTIAGVSLAVDVISEHTPDAGVTIDGVLLKDGNIDANDVVIRGNLVVEGETTSLNVTNLEIEDNIIQLNKGEIGAGVTKNTSGFEVDRGTLANNVQFVWNETEGAFRAQDAAGELVPLQATFDILVGREQGGFGVSIADHADNSLVFANGDELAKGLEDQVLTSLDALDPEGMKFKYVQKLYNAEAGTKVVDVSEANSVSGEYLQVLNSDGKLFLTARNEAGTGDVDLYIQGQGNGDVIIAASADSHGLIIGEKGTSLTVAGGNADGKNAGDLVLKGGDGVDTFESGNLVLQGGTGGAKDGTVIIRDSAGKDVAHFTGGVEDAGDYVDFINGIGSAQVKASGVSVDTDLVLVPKGAGFVLVPDTYILDVDSPAEAVVHKGYLDAILEEVTDNVDPLVRRAGFAADGVASAFNVGLPLNNVLGRKYYVSRIVLHVSTELQGNGVTQMIVGDGVKTLATAAESDILVGTYLIDLPFADATDGGSTFAVTFQTDSAVPVAPTTGSVVAVVEYKVV